MIIRVKKNTNYTIVSNEVLASKELSLKAKGLYAYMISLPDDWNFSMAGLQACLKEGKDAIRSTMQELCEFGIAIHDKKRAEDGTFTSEMTIFQEVQPERQTQSGKPNSETPPQLSNNRLSNKNKNPTLFCEGEVLPKNTAPIHDGFVEFWKEYPRLGDVDIGSKKEAEKKYKQALSVATHEEIFAGVKRYKAYLQAPSRTWTQNAAGAKTWLHQQCWTNEYLLPIEEETPAERGIRLRAEWKAKEARGEAIVF